MAELSMRVEALLVGIPAPFRGDEKSGIVKLPVTGPVQIGALGLEGDGQADLIYHGGPDKAVHLYVQDHYRSEEHTSELQSLMRISYAVFCLKKKIKTHVKLPTHIDII